MAPKSETEITTEVTTLEEKTENQPDDKPNVLPITQMPSPIPKRTFCRFTILSNTVRCFQITHNHRNNLIEKGNKKSMTPKPKTAITTQAAILVDKTDKHPREKSNVLPTTQLSSSLPYRDFCRLMIGSLLLPPSISKCHEVFPEYRFTQMTRLK